MNFAFDQKGTLPFVVLVIIEAEGLSAVKHKVCEGTILHHNMNMSKSVKSWLKKIFYKGCINWPDNIEKRRR